MANKFTRFLKGAVQGITEPKGNLGDFRHASRLYVDNTFALAPRTKFLYHVYFDINPAALQAPQFKERHMEEAGLLVKTAELPKFNLDFVTKNQYNRKKLVYKMINYEPVTITMHDDNLGVINSMWALYFGYYSRDRHNDASRAWPSDPYKSADIQQLFRYGLDSDRKDVPFFRSIQIFTMSRKRFNSYTLINPIITAWNHGNVDQSQGGSTMEGSMTIAYESVLYGTGEVAENNPKGFANLRYDKTPSPLSIFGGGTSTLFGDGGVVAGATTIFGNLYNRSAFDSPASFLRTVAGALNTYKNLRNIAKNPDLLVQEGINILLSPGAVTNIISGVSGVVFPKNTGADAGGNTNTTPAAPKVFPRAGGDNIA
jgi:hypothetical protein